MKLTAEQLAKLKALRVKGNRLREAMALAGVTQVQMAEAAGMQQSGVSHLINNQRKGVDLAVARRLAAVLGAHVDDIFPITGSRK